MTFARWNGLATKDPFSRFIESMIAEPWIAAPHLASGDGEWVPATDVSSDADGYLFRFDLPGVAKDDIDVSIEKGVLKVGGERHGEAHPGEDGSERNVHRAERVVGRFTRAFKLPADADGGRVSASYVDGVLELHIAKHETSKPRKIQISEAN